MAIGAGFKFTYAGAVYISSRGGKTVINDSYIVNNVADYVVGDVYSVGGGIYTEARAGLWLTNSVFRNSALDGGALYSYNLANVNILNSTIAGNTAVYGGGIYGFGTINLTNSVVALNRANTAGNDVYRGPGSLNVYLRSEIYAHNILSSYSKWDNFAEPDCHGYVYDSSRPLFVVDPKFNSLGQLINGNIVDLMLTAGSQALDLGLLDSETHSVLYPDVVPNIFDLAGKSIPYALNGNDPSSAKVFRVIGPSVDLGAYEYTVVPASTAGPYVNEEGVVVTTLDDVVDYSDGKISLREAIQIAGTQFENLKVGSKITFDPSLASNEELGFISMPNSNTCYQQVAYDRRDESLGKRWSSLINADGSEENRLRVRDSRRRADRRGRCRLYHG